VAHAVQKGHHRLPSEGQRLHVPLVVLINGDSKRKEGLAYVLKKTKRAILVASARRLRVPGTSPATAGGCDPLYVPECTGDGVRLEPRA